METRRLIALHFTNLAHSKVRQRQETIFAEGDKNGKLLANLAAEQKTPVSIPVVRGRSGTLITDPAHIREEFVQFYSSLYSPIPPYDPLELDGLLKNLSMPRLMLYSDSRTAIQLGITVSDFFAIGRGTRQGCPLSLFLFALMMEPIARALRQSREAGEIKVGMIKECVALYADDLLLFLRDPGPSLRAALRLLDEFASFLGLHVNWSK